LITGINTIHADKIPFFVKAEEQLSFFDSTTAGIGALVMEKTGLALPFSPLVESLFFLVFLACFLVFALIFRKEGVGLIANFKNFFLFQSHKSTFSEQITTTKAQSGFFFIAQASLIVAIITFIFLLKDDWGQFSLGVYALIFGAIFAIISLFLCLKYLLYKFIGTFFLRDDMNDWIEHYFRIIKLSGFLLFIPTALYIYFGELREVAHIVVVIIFFISRLAIIIKLLNIFVKNQIGLFYFIVYLCGTEIAPYILYFKGVFLLTNFVGSIII
jgi:hypothetical protein